LIFGSIFTNVNDISHLILTLSVACVFPVMGLFIFLLFRIRRLKNGFPFLHEKHISLLGVIIALIIFQTYTVISVISESLGGTLDNISLLLVLSIAICGVLIYIWWRTGITRTFKDTLVDRERNELNRELTEKDKRLAEIEKDNAALSRIIHNDRKRIEALRKVAIALSSETSAELTVDAQDLLAEIERVDTERQKELNAYKKDSKLLPTTRITSLDITLDYMKQKAYENDIEFDVFISGNIKYMIENLISEEQLRTITADLLENAIVATKSCDFRQILFTIGICDNSYEIRVEDSGIAFEVETLRDLGKKRTTTHKNEGGSGIGMMETFAIADATGASIVIESLLESGRGFTKRVSLRFDGKNEHSFVTESKMLS
jgi:signal transduction histidine kinase